MNADRDRSERPDLERDLTKLLAADRDEEPETDEVTLLRESRDALIEHNRQLIEERRALLDFRAAVMDDHFGYDPDDPADVQEVLTFMPAWKGEDTARRERLEEAEAALTRVRELADEAWLDGKHNVAHDVVDASRLRAALDPASPAPGPDSDAAGDMGTRAGSAPSEGHSEAQGERGAS